MGNTLAATVIEGEVVGVSPLYATVRLSASERPYTIMGALRGAHDVSPGDRVRVADPASGEPRVIEVLRQEEER